MLSHLTFMFHPHLIHRLDLYSTEAATMLSRLTKNSIPIYLLCITGTAVFFSFSWNLSVYFFSAQKSSLCGCHTCLKEGNPWFRNLISASPEPFLSRRNETSKEVFNWWKVNVNIEVRLYILVF